MTWSQISRHLRGYGAAWDRKRKRILERDRYLCQCDECKRDQRVTPAREVNHIVSKADGKARGWTDEQIDDDSNLQAINHDCHERVTKEQKGHKHHALRVIGADGFPIESEGEALRTLDARRDAHTHPRTPRGGTS
jgi:5-methylcytosine-specific restriction endonuclease McrA